jgi:hypothetical protein
MLRDFGKIEIKIKERIKIKSKNTKGNLKNEAAKMPAMKRRQR